MKNEKLINVIENIPENQSKLLRYLFVDGMKQKDIAKTMGISNGQVSKLKNKAFKAIREGLGERYYG